MSNQEDEKVHHNDEEMSLEERVAWLRERGVQIETSEERKRAQVANAIRKTENMVEDEISYILIPSDTSQPLQELYYNPEEISNCDSGDILLEHLKTVMNRAKASKDDIDIELLKANTSTTLASTSNLLNDIKLSDETLRQVASEANVEVFSLVRPMPSNKFTGVNIYLDEVGMLKRLPLNKRASDYAYQAGYNPPPQFYGDVYLGRIQQRPTIRNVSIRLGADTALDASWLQSAASDNLMFQKDMNEITGRKDVTQPPIAGQDGKAKIENGYSWTQSEGELEVIVNLPADAKSTDINVRFHPQSLQVAYQKEPKLKIQLFERIDIDSCTWTLDKVVGDKRNVIISMEKVESAFWPRIAD